MSLKDDVERLIRTEEKRLASRDRQMMDAYRRHQEVQAVRFEALRRRLEELRDALPVGSAQVTIGRAAANFQVGEENEDDRTGTQWEVSPNESVQTMDHLDAGLSVEEPGWQVTSAEYFQSLIELSPTLVGKETRTFTTDQALVEHLVQAIAAKVAYYRYRASKRTRTV